MHNINLLRGLVAAYNFNKASYSGSSGEVTDSSGLSGIIKENLIANSENLTAGGWASLGTPVVTATTVEDNSAAAHEGRFVAVIKDFATEPYTFTASVPKETGSPAFYPGLSINANTGIVIDTVNGTVTVSTTHPFAPTNWGIEEDPEDLDYWRAFITSDRVIAGTLSRGYVIPAVNTDASATWTVNTQGTNTFKRIQFEASTSPSSYIQTTGTAITEFFNHGRAINDVTTVAAGKLGRCINFEESSSHYINCGNNSSLSLTQWTFNTWVNLETRTDEPIISKSVAGATDYRFRINATKVQSAFAATTGGVKSVTTSTVIPLNTWTMISTTFDGQFIKIYINGELDIISSDFSAFTVRDNGYDVWIGRQQNAYFDGKMDLTRIYNTPKNEAEISALYNNTRGLIVKPTEVALVKSQLVTPQLREVL